MKKTLQVKVKIPEKTAESDQSVNRLDQYNRKNNLEIQIIPLTAGDEVLTVTVWANQTPKIQMVDLSIENFLCWFK